MRTNEERIAAMHARAAELNQKNRARKVKVLQWTSAAASLAAVIVLALITPRFVTLEDGPAGPSPLDMQGSILAANGAIGYLVIVIVAFLLGVAVTIFCFKLKQWRDNKDEEDML